jgi:GTP-binding protein EngB required for normal cell division
VVWLLDIRHPPSRDDQGFHALLVSAGRPVLAVLTKADKLNRTGRDKAVRERTIELGLEADQLQAVSAVSGDGIAALAEAILAAREEFVA